MLGVCHCYIIVCITCFYFPRLLCTLYASCHVLCFVTTKHSVLRNMEDPWLEKGGILKEFLDWFSFILVV